MKVLLYTVWNAHWYSTFPRERQKRNHDYDSQVSTLLFIYLIRYSTGDALRAAISNFYSSLIFEGTDKSRLPFPTFFSIKSCEDAQSSTFLIWNNIFLDSLSPNVSHIFFFHSFAISKASIMWSNLGKLSRLSSLCSCYYRLLLFPVLLLFLQPATFPDPSVLNYNIPIKLLAIKIYVFIVGDYPIIACKWAFLFC